MKLGMEVGLGPGHIVFDGDPAPLKRAQPPPNFQLMSIVAIRSLISATAELLLGRLLRVDLITLEGEKFFPISMKFGV